MVTFIVGSPPTKFIVHEEVLKAASESQFFRVAFNNGFKETETGELDLPEDDPQAFQVLLQWVYGTATGCLVGERKAFFQKVTMPNLLKLYTLASKYMMDPLHDAVITHLWSQSACWLQLGLTPDAMAYFEANTMADCHMDKLLVDWMATDVCNRVPPVYATYHSILEFVPDRLMRAVFLKLNQSYQTTKGELCSYHRHSKHRPCPAPRYSLY